jgi:transposase InsO family protein
MWHDASWQLQTSLVGSARSPQTNGICERFHRTIQEEFYSVAFRKKLYRTLDELQADLDAWLREYNEQREHSGKYGYSVRPDRMRRVDW